MCCLSTMISALIGWPFMPQRFETKLTSIVSDKKCNPVKCCFVFFFSGYPSLIWKPMDHSLKVEFAKSWWQISSIIQSKIENPDKKRWNIGIGDNKMHYFHQNQSKLHQKLGIKVKSLLSLGKSERLHEILGKYCDNRK